MPTKEELKDRAFAEIDSRAEELISLSKQILANPEPGFREFKPPRWLASSLRP